MSSSVLPFFSPRGVVIIGASTSPEKLSHSAARKIAPHVDIVKSVLRLFDELAKCDKDNLLKDVRDTVAGSTLNV